MGSLLLYVSAAEETVQGQKITEKRLLIAVPVKRKEQRGQRERSIEMVMCQEYSLDKPFLPHRTQEKDHRIVRKRSVTLAVSPISSQAQGKRLSQPFIFTRGSQFKIKRQPLFLYISTKKVTEGGQSHYITAS